MIATPQPRVTRPLVTLRRVKVPADTELLIGIYAATRAEELAPVPWTDAQRDAFIRMQFAAQDSCWRERNPDMRLDVILVDGAPAGRLYVDRRRDEIRIVDIALAPEHRGRGAASVLLRDILDEGRRAGLRVSIHVERHNRARRLYERLGFVQVGSTGVYDLLERRPDPTADSDTEASPP